MRRIVGRFAVAAGCPDDRAQDIVLAISELATNSLLHGGGTGRMAYWCDSDTIVCEIRDRGSTLAVPARPGGPTARAGHGLRLVAAVCDDVSRATTHDGMVTRVTFRY